MAFARSDFFRPELFFILFSYVVPKDLQIQGNIRRIFLRKYAQNKNISHPHLITRCRKLTGIFTLNKKTTQIFIWWWSIELLIDCCTFFTYVGFVMVIALSAQIWALSLKVKFIQQKNRSCIYFSYFKIWDSSNVYGVSQIFLIMGVTVHNFILWKLKEKHKKIQLICTLKALVNFDPETTQIVSRPHFSPDL